MSSDEVGYLACRSGKGIEKDADFQLLDSIDEARKWVDSGGSDGEGETINEENEIDADGSQPIFDPSSIRGIQSTFIDHISAYKALVVLVTAIRPALLDSFLEKHIIVRAEDHYELTEERGGYKIYKIRQADLSSLEESIDRSIEMVRGLLVLPSSTLLSLVATFDSFIADVAFRAIRTNPKIASADRNISLQTLLQMRSFDEAVDHVVWQDVRDGMRGSHSEQVKFIERVSDTSISKHFERWSDFVEIFERRNLVAHNGLVVNDIYLKNCKDVGYDVSDMAVGKSLKLDPKYLRQCVDVLLEFGILLLYSLWRKRHKDDSEGAFLNLDEIALDLIKRRNPLVASRILAFALHKQPRVGVDLIIKRMTLNLATSYKKLNLPDKVTETLDSTDWSSASDMLKIGLAALRDDVAEVVSLMPRVADDDEIGSEGLRHSPIFDSVRDDSKFQKAFEDIFGEPVGRPSIDAKMVADASEAEARSGISEPETGD